MKTLLPRVTVFSISENPEKHEDEVKNVRGQYQRIR